MRYPNPPLGEKDGRRERGREGERERGREGESRHRIRQDDTVKQSEWQRNEKREIKANMVQEDGEQRGKLLG